MRVDDLIMKLCMQPKGSAVAVITKGEFYFLSSRVVTDEDDNVILFNETDPEKIAQLDYRHKGEEAA